jgi:hypothetical protein
MSSSAASSDRVRSTDARDARTATGRPHSPQNMAPAGSSVAQLEQITETFYRLKNLLTL